MSPSALALTGFISWTLSLLVLMEIIRSQLVLRGRVRANAFTPDNAGLSPFMQRLARAHANCIESLPVFGGLLIVGMATGRTAITDPLAYVLLGARIFQSLVHLGCGDDSLQRVRSADGDRRVLGIRAVGFPVRWREMGHSPLPAPPLQQAIEPAPRAWPARYLRAR